MKERNEKNTTHVKITVIPGRLPARQITRSGLFLL